MVQLQGFCGQIFNKEFLKEKYLNYLLSPEEVNGE